MPCFQRELKFLDCFVSTNIAMIDNAGQKRLMMQYLLGELSAGERTEFEDTYLKDSGVFQELVTAENELIDQYILGELSSADREKFERSFLSNPARRETVETARSLLAYSAAAEGAISPQVSELRPAKWYGRWVAQATAAGVFLTMIGGILLLLVANRRLGNELARLEREKAAVLQDQQSLRRQVEGLQAELQQRDATIQQMAQLMPDVVPFTLGPGVPRGDGESQNLVVPARASYVLLHVLMEDDSHPRYVLSLRTAEGDLIWHKENIQAKLSAGKKEISVTLPSHLLKNGDYVVKISKGNEDLQHTLAGYSFHVIKR